MMISDVGREYRTRVVSICQGMPRIQGDVSVGMVLYPPDRRRRDLDNYRKALWDALTHAGIWEDDSQVTHDEGWKGPVVRGGVIMVQIRRQQATKIPEWAGLGALDDPGGTEDTTADD